MNKAHISQFIKDANKLKGFYNGKVVDIADPEASSRVRVAVYNLTDELPKDDLPWYPTKQTFNTSPNAKSVLPPVGSEVVVEFPDNDIYNGIVSFVIVSKPPSK